MSTSASARLLVGRMIVTYDARPFPDRQGRTAHRPVITLDNGARLIFVTEETDTGDYGVCAVYVPRGKS